NISRSNSYADDYLGTVRTVRTVRTSASTSTVTTTTDWRADGLASSLNGELAGRTGTTAPRRNRGATNHRRELSRIKNEISAI
ncbi:hypothetical protein BZM27_27465, partial [Paraburkholderia steynii]